MVKSYERFEQDNVFGVIAGSSNVVWLPHTNSTGRALVGALEAVCVWDIKTGQLLSRMVDGLVPGASNAPTTNPPPVVTRVCYYETTNLAGVGYNDGSIKVWDLTSQSVVVSFNGHRSAITQLQFDSSGTRLVSGSADTSVIVWDLVGEEGLFRLKGHKGPITGLSLVGDEDDYLITCSKDGMVKLWEMASQQCLETHLGHANECWSLAVHHDLVITSGKENKAWKLDVTAEEHKLSERGVFPKQSSSRTNHVEFNGSRFMIQNADKSIEIMRLRGDDEIKKGVAKRTKRLKEKGYTDDEIAASLQESEMSILITDVTIIRGTGKYKSATFSPSGAVVANAANALEFWKVPSGKKDIVATKLHTVDLPGHRTDVRAMDMSSDAKLVVTASTGELKVWNMGTSKVIRSFVTQGAGLCCKFLPGNTLVAIGYKNGILELFDLASSRVVDSVQGHGTSAEPAAVWSMDLTADGQTLVTGGNDKSVKFWKFKVGEDYDGQTSLKFKHHQTLEVGEDVLAVKVSPDQRLLAVSLLNNNIQVVFFDTLKLFLTLYGHKLPVLALDISADSKLLVSSSADKNVKLWGLDFGDCHKSIFAHQDSVMQVRFLGDTHHFFSSGKDGLVKYWDGDKFECIQKLAAHQSEVWCLAAGPEGDVVVSASHDHSVRVWRSFGDQVFIEEEKEKEMDELYESELLEDPHADPNKDEDDDEDKAERVQKQTMESLKAGERVMEALDIGYDYVVAKEKGENYVNAILQHMKQTGPEHVLSVVRKVSPAQLDDALLVLPFSYTLKLLRMIEEWTKPESAQSLADMQLVCKVLFFVVRSNARELIQQKDAKLRQQLANVKDQIRSRLGAVADQVGTNTAAMRFVQQQWKLEHESGFGDDDAPAKGKKRVFTTVA
ncbi:hypothetical protein DIURU_000328 [Diutina rugosa]|uniref:Small-subunit processome Utp12 domain-containing protein n=1 Tax=Diutina rugosa TaxID=5481 RepID=A0A642UYE1_DIURU|nr:uncharacterized protein DIURU_000328 [Diutina rugosa]KAA8907918.1 hypothetical protein DIURU_000328 [Diutina rugosa]